MTVQTYIDRLGQKIAAQFQDATFPFSFSVFAEDPCPSIHEPATLPGGYVFVPAALFLAARDEAEFAAMLAHAMAHIVKRHGTRAATRDPATNSGAIPLIFFGGWAGSCSNLVPLAFQASLRANELEADALAIETVAKAGFDPQALWRYLERVQVPLPDRDQRLSLISSAIEKLPSVAYTAASADEFASARQEVRRLSERPALPDRPPTLKRKPAGN
jgi:predicted Zn-dependent protease